LVNGLFWKKNVVDRRTWRVACWRTSWLDWPPLVGRSQHTIQLLYPESPCINDHVWQVVIF
jgi:hypothetical protein